MESKKIVVWYVVGWSTLSILLVTFFVVTGFTMRVHTCIDGTQVKDPRECPQCITDDQCSIDRVCEEGMCTAKRCQFDSECEADFHGCVFGFCRLG